MTASGSCGPISKAYTEPGHVKGALHCSPSPPGHYVGVSLVRAEDRDPRGLARRRHVSLYLERTRWGVARSGSTAPGSARSAVWSPRTNTISGRCRRAATASASGSIPRTCCCPYRPDGHSVSDSLDAAWNGISSGTIELRATTPVWIDDARVFPEVAKRAALIKVQVGSRGQRARQRASFPRAPSPSRSPGTPTAATPSWRCRSGPRRSSGTNSTRSCST